MKAGVIIPQSPGCPPTEDKNFPQHVRVNLNIVNRSTNSRRPTDYHKRSTSPWTLQYVRPQIKPLHSSTSEEHIRLPVKSSEGGDITHSESPVKPGRAIVQTSDSLTLFLQISFIDHSSSQPIHNT